MGFPRSRRNPHRPCFRPSNRRRRRALRPAFDVRERQLHDRQADHPTMPPASAMGPVTARFPTKALSARVSCSGLALGGRGHEAAGVTSSGQSSTASVGISEIQGDPLDGRTRRAAAHQLPSADGADRRTLAAANSARSTNSIRDRLVADRSYVGQEWAGPGSAPDGGLISRRCADHRGSVGFSGTTGRSRGPVASAEASAKYDQ